MTDDAVLVKKTLAGDKKAYDELMQRHMSRCYRIARYYGLSPEDAADLVQDTFFAAYRALSSFDFNYRFSTWITRILLNRLSNFHRGLKRAKKFFMRAKQEALQNNYLETKWGNEPDKNIERAELHQAITKAVAKLPRPQRIVFILFEMEGVKIKDIAKMLNIPEGTVTSRLHYARKILQKNLKHFL